MRFSDRTISAVAFFLLVTIWPAAACFVCDEVVELDQIRASCFLADYEKFETAIRQSQDRRTEIDLSACANDVASGVRGIDALPLFPTSQDSGPALQTNLRSVYILDEKGTTCLKKLLEERAAPINPSIRINLSSECP